MPAVSHMWCGVVMVTVRVFVVGSVMLPITVMRWPWVVTRTVIRSTVAWAVMSVTVGITVVLSVVVNFRRMYVSCTWPGRSCPCLKYCERGAALRCWCITAVFLPYLFWSWCPKYDWPCSDPTSIFVLSAEPETLFQDCAELHCPRPRTPHPVRWCATLGRWSNEFSESRVGLGMGAGRGSTGNGWKVNEEGTGWWRKAG